MKSSETYRILRDRFSDGMKSLGWIKGRGGVPNWFIPIGDEYALFWFQVDHRPGWNDYWGSEFTMEFQVAEYAEWGHGAIDRRRRFGELLDQKDLDEIRTRQNEIIRSLVRPPTDYKFLSRVPSEDEWIWERFEEISAPYSSEHDIWLRYHSSEDVDRWGAFLLDRFPGMWDQFTILLKEEANQPPQPTPGLSSIVEDELDEMLKRQRSYAGYFHFRGDQEGTEMDVVENWLQARFERPEEHYSKMEPRQNPLDPPDVVLTDMKGRRIGIEATELVDGPTISAWEKGLNTDFKLYEKEEFFALLRERIGRKSKSEFKGPPYAGKVLVIYSDEPELCRDDFLRSSDFDFESGSFDEVWFIMPPKPNTSGDSPLNPECQIYLIAKDDRRRQVLTLD